MCNIIEATDAATDIHLSSEEAQNRISCDCLRFASIIFFTDVGLDAPTYTSLKTKIILYYN